MIKVLTVSEARAQLPRLISSESAAVPVGSHRNPTALILAGRVAERLMPYVGDEGFSLPSELPDLPRLQRSEQPLLRVNRTARKL